MSSVAICPAEDFDEAGHLLTDEVGQSLDEEADALSQLADLYDKIVFISSTLSMLSALAVGVGLLWWNTSEPCSKLWAGFVICTFSQALFVLSEARQARSSKDAAAYWLMQSFSTLPPSTGHKLCTFEQLCNIWGCFMLGLFIGLQIVVIVRDGPCRTELLVSASVCFVCLWIRVVVMFSGAMYARNRKSEVMGTVVGSSRRKLQVSTWYTGPGRFPIQLFGHLGAGSSGKFLALYTWL